MSVQGMNHFTVLSDNLEETRKFYCDLLGFEEGPRPNFRFPGYWLYVGNQPILHVIHRDQLSRKQWRTGVPVCLLPAVVIVLRLRCPRDHELHTLGFDFQLHC